MANQACKNAARRFAVYLSLAGVSPAIEQTSSRKKYMALYAQYCALSKEMQREARRDKSRARATGPFLQATAAHFCLETPLVRWSQGLPRLYAPVAARYPSLSRLPRMVRASGAILAEPGVCLSSALKRSEPQSLRLPSRERMAPLSFSAAKTGQRPTNTKGIDHES